jgi:autotransporter-associated beta strand protein
MPSSLNLPARHANVAGAFAALWVLLASTFLLRVEAAPGTTFWPSTGEQKLLILRPTYLSDLNNPTSYVSPQTAAEAQAKATAADTWMRAISYGQAWVTPTIYPANDTTRMVLTTYNAAAYTSDENKTWQGHATAQVVAQNAGIPNANASFYNTSWRFIYGLMPAGFDGQAYVHTNHACGASKDTGDFLHELTHCLGFNHGSWAYDGKLSGPQRIFLKWLTNDDGTPTSPTSGYIAPTASGIYRLYDLDTATKLGPGKAQSILIQRTTSTNTGVDLYLEYRPQDKIRGSSTDISSALGLRLIDWNIAEKENNVMDAQPGGANDDYNRALLPGIPWVDTDHAVPYAGTITGTNVEITVLSRQDTTDPKYLDVRLKFPGDPGPVPAAPASASATSPNYSTVNLTWANTSTNETGFLIERSTSPSSGFVPITTTAANVTSFSDTGLGGLITYYYRVYAVNLMGDSTGYASTSVTTPIEPPGTIRLTAASYSVGDLGTTLTISAERITNSGGAVAVNFITSDGSALAGSDYTAANGTLTWADHETGTKSFTVNILGDNVPESDETFTVTLSNPSGGASLGSPSSATVTISENPGSLGFSVAYSNVGEAAGTATFTVQRTGGKTGAVSATYATANGTGSDGTHYTATSGTLNWADGDTTSRQINVPILNNPTYGSNKTFSVNLSGLTGGAQAAATTTSATIVNDDAPVITLTRPSSASFLMARTGTVQFTGTVNEDDPPASSSLTYSWQVLSAPSGGSFSFTPSNALNSLATVSTPSESSGNYTLRLTATGGNFTTTVDLTAVVSSPVVLTNTAQPIGLNQANLRGELLVDAGLPTQIRCYYGDNDGDTNPAAWDQVIDLGNQPIGALSTVITGLTPGPVYYFRFRATNSGSDDWSFNSQSFQIQQWSGQTSTAWATDTNWTSGTAPANNTLAAIALFNLPTYGGNPVFAPDAGTRNIAGITVGSSNGAMTLSGTSLAIGPNGLSVQSGAGNTTITTPITLASPQTWSLQSSNSTFTSNATIATDSNPLGVETASATTLSGPLTGSGAITKSGNGTLTLSGSSSTYTGAITVSQGTLNVSHANALGATAQTTTVAQGATLQLGGITLAEPLVLSGTLAAGSGTNTCSGAVTLSGPATLQNDLATNFTVSGNITTGGFGLTVNTSNGTASNVRMTLGSSNINGAGSLTKNGPARLQLTGVATFNFTGGLIINQGTVLLGNNSSGSAANLSSVVTLSSGATLINHSNGSQTIKGLQGAGGTLTMELNTRRTTIINTAASTSYDFAGSITNGSATKILAITKSGLGTQILSGNNTYTGNTTVSAGTLLVNGSLSSSTTDLVDINANGTLGGNGTINRPVNVAANALLAPGNNAVGNLTVSSLSMDPASTYTCELGASNTSDRIRVTGNATIDGTLALAGTITPGTYRVLTCTGTLTDNGFVITGLPQDFTATVAVASGNVDLVLTSTVSLPDAPTNLTATTASSTQINLGWADNATTETGFKLERKTGPGGTWSQVATPAANATTLTDPGLAPGTLYFYRLRATNGTGDSAYTDEASATTRTAFAQWALDNGLPENTLSSADPDGDGLNNLLEYAFNGNPTSAASAPGPSVSLLPAPGSTLQITFLRARPELTYEVQSSTDLSTWTTLATNPGIVSTTTLVTYTDPSPVTTRRFLRLRITQ